MLARTGRTDCGRRCPPRLLGCRTPLAAHQSRLPACCTLVRSFRLSCPLLLDAVRVTTWRDQSGEEKMKGNTASQERGANGQCISKSLAAATPGIEAQIIAVCVIASVILFFFFFLFFDISLMSFFPSRRCLTHCGRRSRRGNGKVTIHKWLFIQA